ncbi:hypothetical protein [Fredinandcohnia onubensis]|uniref:hypothetical protein n=1 Tax=Fredinandcohnia onubensis TaxID=1571209 RepID=UPI000C0BD671|nr:hypothetical protein [Fredinandcohnia onubensis]
MQVFATFKSNDYMEIAIAEIEKTGIKSEDIFAVPLDKRKEDVRLFDTLNRSDGTTLFDIGAALATAFSVIGASIGFNLTWGPIYWGLIGAAVGFMIGFAIRLCVELVSKKKKRSQKGNSTEIILIIECEEPQAKQIEFILWEYHALGVAKVKVNT